MPKASIQVADNLYNQCVKQEYCDMGPAGIRDDQDPFQRSFLLSLHCASRAPPTLKSVFTPPKRGVFFASRDGGTSREAGCRERCLYNVPSSVQGCLGSRSVAGRDVRTAALAPPCASRHLDVLSSVAGGREKVSHYYGHSPGREAGPGCARKKQPEAMCLQGWRYRRSRTSMCSTALGHPVRRCTLRGPTNTSTGLGNLSVGAAPWPR